MKKIFWKKLSQNEIGGTAIEYGVVAMLIGVALAGVMLSLGDEVETQYNTIESEYADANKDAGGN
ncbi:Flp family type IVb pilin [Aurantiacibacter sp. D1-12]|uniref:Flp family type IVb pilin n=1 Tax=Aurantiacibacter sp. D1-12 TaxID=2993658 RepID=UPI00237C52E3|nr:Flp family type IVb pilin [Aurantiacibacter sp. D1-12]MDE1468321.1 Flp family type IVb pilin [Aurantiacibacter sp. D1-12]